jgi:photosystem II stability/assembly factor-like uncharacterized protein
MSCLAATGQGLRYTWRSIEMVGGGFISGMVTHPRSQGVMYARTDVGGAYRWDAARERWDAITDWIGQSDWRHTGVESLAVDASDPERVYLALGIYNQPRLGPAAICRSNDRGESWQVAQVPFGMGGNEAGRGCGERLSVDPACGDVLFFGSRDSGLWRSGDGGVRWARVDAFPVIETALDNPTPGRWNYLTQAVGVIFVIFAPQPPRSGSPTRRVYAGVSTRGTSLFCSNDAGTTWQPVAGQPVGLRPIRAVMSSKGVLFISYGREPGPNTMFDGAVYAYDTETGRFTDVTPIPPDPEHGQTFGYAGIAVDAANPECVMVATAYRGHAPGTGGDELFRSLDSGRSWKAIGQSGRRDHRRAPWLCFGGDEADLGHWMYALVIDPFDSNKAYYGTGQTIWGTSNLCAVDRGERSEWIVQARGIEETVPLALVSPPRGAAVIAGTGDISGFAVFGDDALTEVVAMHQPTFKDTTGLDFAEHDPALIVRVGGRGWNRERDRDTGAFSVDAGRTWSAFCAYPSDTANEGQVAVSADGASWLWAPKAEPAVVSRDRSASWQPCHGLPKGPLRVVSDRARAGVYYAFERQGRGAFWSTDGGATFVKVGTELPGSGLTDAIAVFGREGHVWALVEQGLHCTADGGAHWREVTGLTRPSHIGIGKAFDGGYPTLFAVAQRDGKDGFFSSVDQGQCWHQINDERHQFGQVRAISGDPKRFGRLYVATGGRGVVYGEQA